MDESALPRRFYCSGSIVRPNPRHSVLRRDPCIARKDGYRGRRSTFASSTRDFHPHLARTLVGVPERGNCAGQGLGQPKIRPANPTRLPLLLFERLRCEIEPELRCGVVRMDSVPQRATTNEAPAWQGNDSGQAGIPGVHHSILLWPPAPPQSGSPSSIRSSLNEGVDAPAVAFTTTMRPAHCVPEGTRQQHALSLTTLEMRGVSPLPGRRREAIARAECVASHRIRGTSVMRHTWALFSRAPLRERCIQRKKSSIRPCVAAAPS